MNLAFVRESLRRTFRLASTSYLAVDQTDTKECKDKVLVVGLGNYCAPRSRHSVGQSLLEHVAERHQCQFEYKRSVKGHLASFVHNEFEVYLLKPKVFMNLSGKSVGKATQLLKIAPGNVLLLHDELDLPLGKFRVKSGGSANGHNGVRDTQERLKHTDLKRILIGIGRPPDKDDVADYVLEDFTKPEKLLLRAMYGDLSELLLNTANIIVNPQDAKKQPKKKNKPQKKVKILDTPPPATPIEPPTTDITENTSEQKLEESAIDPSTPPDHGPEEQSVSESPGLSAIVLGSEVVKISEIVQTNVQADIHAVKVQADIDTVIQSGDGVVELDSSATIQEPTPGPSSEPTPEPSLQPSSETASDPAKET